LKRTVGGKGPGASRKGNSSKLKGKLVLKKTWKGSKVVSFRKESWKNVEDRKSKRVYSFVGI